MKRGFTLLEIIVVIVILGVMATLAITQYTKMVEKSRGAEARTILGNLRTNQAAMGQQTGACSSVDSDVGIGVDFPSTCTSTHYFSYDLAATSGNVFTATATRCTASGKSPNAATAGVISLITNFDNGFDSWILQAPY
jgi:type IV pilus assembly protein PilA